MIAEFGGDITTGPFGTLLKASEYTEDGVPLISAGEIRKGFISVKKHTPRVNVSVTSRMPQYVLREGDIVFGRKGAVDRSARVTGSQDGWFLGSDGIALRLPDVRCDSRFISFLLQDDVHAQWIVRHALGSTMLSLNQQIIRRIPLLLPPLSEQRKIAAVLSTWDRAMELTEKLIATKRKQKQALMQLLLTDKVSESEKVRFKSVCKVVEGQVDPKVKPYCDMIHIGPGNVAKATGELLGVRTAKEDRQTSGKYLFAENHVLYSKIRPHLAKVCYPRRAGICSADMYPVECDESRVLPGFLYYSMLSRHFTKYAVSVSARTGMPKINRNDLDAFWLTLPPLEKQVEACGVLDAASKGISLLRRRKASLSRQKRGLMQQLLTGKVRVNEMTIEAAEN
ncbi:restriction endonuclease subunit S [Alienimonas sp. DA493]|uniref:restriction endonuclease subunit S n=1 Tax=Alienimonas sp. DA493 TaxID=3373605 RepID=UPI00375494FA